ncbi:type VII secretion protein EccB [Kribbella sp. NPDC004536]|uniref:type VII secretion protein EccB n=1 Tax=Kribbella sp. NPDC004536 TaxID=3364106 RepID=UPI003690A01A
MASKRDQLQSHQFVKQRMTHALLLRETDPEYPPFRRGIVAMMVGIGLAVLVLVGCGVYGQLSPGGKTTWKSGDRVIVEKETGTRYVYRDGVLYPAANYVSALLLLNKYSAPLTVSAKSLLGVPRGQRVGIPDAPDSLPAKGRLLSSGWSMCAKPTVDSSGSPSVQSVLLVGTEQSGVAADSLLAVGPGGHYLIWHGYKHLIQQQATVAAALALNDEAWLRVPSVWLDLVPSGPPLGPISVPGAGTPSALLRPGRVGTLYVVQTSTGQGQYYLLQRDKLVAITSLQYDVQRTAPATRKAYPGAVPQAVALDPAVVAQVSGGVGTAPSDSALPPTRPTFARPDSSDVSACAVFSGGEFVPRFTLAGDLPATGDAGVTAGRGPSGLPLADVVVVPPGHGAVVESMASPAQPAGSGALSFVSDLGRRYQLASHDVLGVLGYDQAPVVRLPAELISRLPAGHALDPSAATYPIGP